VTGAVCVCVCVWLGFYPLCVLHSVSCCPEPIERKYGIEQNQEKAILVWILLPLPSSFAAFLLKKLILGRKAWVGEKL
jgi:hypothetical protein